MPSILYRLNTLLLAEEFRLRIVKEAHVGNENNPNGNWFDFINQSTIFKYLAFVEMNVSNFWDLVALVIEIVECINIQMILVTPSSDYIRLETKSCRILYRKSTI